MSMNEDLWVLLAIGNVACCCILYKACFPRQSLCKFDPQNHGIEMS